ncbi:MAG: AsmA family protein [Pseudomonadota bacterium]|nr:AsmA family protein [Pseudomonadota bacterium]
MVRAFVFFGGLLVLILSAALIAPFFVDWTAYRADFEREASRIIGREVKVSGAASARLLPFPSVTFEDVTVSGGIGDQPVMTIDRFRMNAELAPYLSGEIRIFSMQLTHPVLTLVEGVPQPSIFPLPAPRVPTGAEVVLEDVEIENGSIVFKDAAKAETARLSNIEAGFSAESLSGPFSGAGTFESLGDRIRFDLTTGRAEDGQATPMRVSLTSPAQSARLDLDGRLKSEEGTSLFEGRLTYAQPQPRIPDPNASADVFAAMDGDAVALRGSVAPDAPEKPPVRAEAQVIIRGDRITTDALRVEVGPRGSPYVLTGGGRVDLVPTPRFDLSLEGEAFNVDSLAGSAPVTSDADGAPPTLSERLANLRSVLIDIPKPEIPGSVRLTLPVVTLGDTTIRNLAFAAEPETGGWRLADLSAELPGRTTVAADGLLALSPSLAFTGDLSVASAQPSGFSDWLTGRVDPAIRALPRAALSARVDLTADRQTLRDLTLDLGGDPITGAIDRLPRRGNGRLTARLEGGAVDLDALRALASVVVGPDEAIASVARYDVALKAGPVKAGAVEAQAIDLDLLYDGETLAIAKLDVDGLAGASFEASGRLTDLQGDALGLIELTLSSSDPEAFLAFLDRMRPGTPLVETLRRRARALAPLDVTGEIESIDRGEGRPTLLLRLDGTADETRLDFSAAIENGFSAIRDSGRVGLELRLESDRPQGLLAQLGLDGGHAASLEGPLEVEMSVSASATGPAIVSASLHGPDTDANLEGVLDLENAGVRSADTSLRLTSASLLPWLTALNVDVGQSFMDLGPLGADLSGSVIYEGRRWRVVELSGQLGESGIEADLEGSAEAGLSGSVRVDRLSLPWLAALIYGAEPLAEGPETWSRAAFCRSRLPDLSYDIALKTDRMPAGPVTLDGVVTRIVGTGDELALRGLTAEIAGGRIAGDITMRNLAGLGGMSADLRADELALAALAPALSTGPNSDVTVTAKLDASAQSAAGLVANLTGAGTLEVVDFGLPGIPVDPLPAVLAAADADDFSADSGTSEAWQAATESASFPVSRLLTDYTVAGGRAVLSPVTVSAEGSKLTITANLDLAALSLSSDLTLALDPDEAEVAGADPVVRYRIEGAPGDLSVTRDTAALANFLSVRALEREQARVEAMQERLEETLRLRREARFYRWLDRRDDERANPPPADDASMPDSGNEALPDAGTARSEETARGNEPVVAKPNAQAGSESPSPAAAAESDAAAEPQVSIIPNSRPSPPFATSNASRRETTTRPSPPAAREAPVPAPKVDFGRAGASAPSTGREDFQSLPGVQDPLQFHIR